MRPTSGAGQLLDDSGQGLAELAIVIPLFALAIVLVGNLLLFAHGAAVFDRAVEQWSRANVANPKEPLPNSALPIWFVLGSNPNRRFQASCAVTASPPGPFDYRECRFTLYFTPFGGEILTAFGASTPLRLSRKKTVVMPHYLRAVVF